MIERMPWWLLSALAWVLLPRRFGRVTRAGSFVGLVALGLLYGPGAFVIGGVVLFLATFAAIAQMIERQEADSGGA